MKTLDRTTLDPRRFTQSIRDTPRFREELPDTPFAELTPEARRESLLRAVASGAISIADTLERQRGEYDLDANLYRLVGNLNSFHEGSLVIDRLREQYQTPRYMPRAEKKTFYDNKGRVTEFNHILREVINAGASRFGFNNLLTFMTNMNAASGNRENTGEFHAQARAALVGMRNEIAVEQVLIGAGIDYELGTLEDDAEGGDIIIENIPIDIKASLNATQRAQEKARQFGRDPNRIIWSHIQFEDYEGQLTLPYRLNGAVYAKMKPDLDKALHS